MCHALVPKEEVQEAETNELIDKVYDGSVDKLFAALLGSLAIYLAGTSPSRQRTDITFSSESNSLTPI